MLDARPGAASGPPRAHIKGQLGSEPRDGPVLGEPTSAHLTSLASQIDGKRWATVTQDNQRDYS